ncbi:hypothetical protein EYF80_040290 [Liparis tanakae]|uniref:Uncharacterized protein n=1 Tax=Liparis tanakae TaxID=230148 RepID=A0A4Z2G7F8_9TELE|nr:hypothetical protein EYF80_040290 [Liparis tanakae]
MMFAHPLSPWRPLGGEQAVALETDLQLFGFTTDTQITRQRERNRDTGRVQTTVMQSQTPFGKAHRMVLQLWDLNRHHNIVCKLAGKNWRERLVPVATKACRETENNVSIDPTAAGRCVKTWLVSNSDKKAVKPLVEVNHAALRSSHIACRARSGPLEGDTAASFPVRSLRCVHCSCRQGEQLIYCPHVLPLGYCRLRTLLVFF